MRAPTTRRRRARRPVDAHLHVGSTGAPKAVRLTQGRAARAATGQMGFRAGDVLYCSMPVFHGNALMSMVFPAFASGASLVFKRKFSASGFLPDVRQLPLHVHQHHRSRAGLHPGHAGIRARQGPRPEVRPRAGVIDRRHEGVQATVRAARVRRLRLERERHRDDPEPGPAARCPGCAGRRTRGRDHRPRDQPGVPAGPSSMPTASSSTRTRRSASSSASTHWTVSRATTTTTRPTIERTRSGWYWSGDLAYRDEAGVFFFAGRNADWIRVDGENFAAAPVERVVNGSRALRASRCSGSPTTTPPTIR